MTSSSTLCRARLEGALRQGQGFAADFAAGHHDLLLREKWEKIGKNGKKWEKMKQSALERVRRKSMGTKNIYLKTLRTYVHV
jgi:hypothetical protein